MRAGLAAILGGAIFVTNLLLYEGLGAALLRISVVSRLGAALMIAAGPSILAATLVGGAVPPIVGGLLLAGPLGAAWIAIGYRLRTAAIGPIPEPDAAV